MHIAKAGTRTMQSKQDAQRKAALFHCATLGSASARKWRTASSDYRETQCSVWLTPRPARDATALQPRRAREVAKLSQLCS